MKALSVHLKNNDIGVQRDKVSNNFIRELAIIDPSTGRSVVILRTYIKGTAFHCCAWFHGSDKFGYGTGYGKATGGGYCKESAAIDEAIAHAGIKLSERFAGVGESAIREAAFAIGRKLTGKRKLIIHYSHA